MRQSLEFDTVEGQCINEELLEGSEVAHRDLVLQKFHTLLEIAHSNVKGRIGWVHSQNSLVRIRTWGRWNEDFRFLLGASSVVAICGRCIVGTLSVKLFIETTKTVIVFSPVGFINVDLLSGCSWLGASISSSVQDIVYLLVGRLELVVVEELLVSLFLVQESLLLEHLFSFLGFFRP